MRSQDSGRAKSTGRRDLLMVGARLSLICVVAAGVLGVVNAVTEPRIALVRERELREALERVAGGLSIGDFVPAEDGEAVNGHHPLMGADGETEGYAVTLTAVGYGGNMRLIAGYLESGEVKAAVLLENRETPGLGKEAEEPDYMEMFVGGGDEKPIPSSKQELSQSQADSISGATITFMGISEALVRGSRYVGRVSR